ncbi:MAG: type II secretion system ATPase GspE [Magnetococcales bacterium]|nr:type II secretion system ATPase GspE [Magnetococcales bacterium]
MAINDPSPDPVQEGVQPSLSPGEGQLSLAYAKRHDVLVASSGSDSISISCGPNATLPVLLELRRHFAKPVTFHKLDRAAFDAVLRRAFEAGSSQAMQDMEELDDSLDLDQVARQLSKPQDLVDSADDAPIIRLINALLTEAVKQNASDIHLEPYEDQVAVRFRVDGVLRKVLAPKSAVAPLLVSRIKVMARLDIAEKRLPQDGRISLRIAGRPVDVRVSTIPTGHGERVVMRLLDKQAGRLDLNQLGMPMESQDGIDRVIRKPNGIILVTGPTGSGKTTTLYAILKRLNDHSRNIMTVEDPIEYNLDGISQTHVNTKVDLTFARGLRAILRQDPDVVMVGEVRDLETARIAVQASLTGHLVLSTLHTNSAIGAITRLRDMGMEPYLLSSSLVAVLAQRLVRMLCPSCRVARSVTEIDREMFGSDGHHLPDQVYGPGRCEQCGHTGFRGRSGIYELMVMNDALRHRIHEGAGEQELVSLVRKETPTLRDDGLRLVRDGLTTPEEVLRVTRED